MKNRLYRLWRTSAFLSSLGLALVPALLSAQQGFFNFSYPGPNIIAVGPDCTGMLAGQLGTPVVSSTSGANITLSQFDPDSSGFTLNTVFSLNQSIIVKWRVADDQGHTALFAIPIVFRDLTPPTLTGIPGPATYNSTLLLPPPPPLNSFTKSDNCSAPNQITVSYQQSALPELCQAGTVTRTWTATDAAGNSAAFSQIITILADTQAPQIVSPPKDSIVACAGGAYQGIFNSWLTARAGLVATDNGTPAGQLVYTMQVNNVTQTAAQVSTLLQNTFSNPCGPQQIGSQMIQKVRGFVGIDFYVADICGQTTYGGRAFFVVIDTLRPVVGRDTLTKQCGGGDDQLALTVWINSNGAGLSLNDGCSPASWTNFSYTTSDGQSGNGNFNTGPYPTVPATTGCHWYADVTFRATDACGNVGSAVSRFEIKDTQGPSFPNLADTAVAYCPATSLTLPPGTVADNCSAAPTATYTQAVQNTQCGGQYTLLVTWTATDACGNTATATQTVLVRDTVGPVFTVVPPTDTIRCDTFATPPAPAYGTELVATDGCGTVATYSFTDASAQNPDPATCGHYTYTITRTFTATDDCGNTATATQLIQVIDNLGPEFVGFTDTVVICGAPPVLPPPAGLDACSGPTAAPVFVNQSAVPGSCADASVLTLTWSAVDVCGNPSTFLQTVHIEDTIAPVLSGIPANVTVQCNAIPAPPVVGQVGASDNCDATPSISFSQTEIRNPDPATCDHWSNYQVVRQWTATDNCGNTASATQTITVTDTVGPVLQIAAPMTVPNTPGLCGVNLTLPTPLQAYDACPSGTQTVVLTQTKPITPNAGNTVPIDTVVFTWTGLNVTPYQPVIGSDTLRIFLEKVEADQPTEVLYILGEDYTSYGFTNNSPPSPFCSNSTTIRYPTANKLNAWLTDGALTFRLAPFGTGGAALNPICSGQQARAQLKYTYTTTPIPVAIAYSIDGGPIAAFPPAGPVFLSTGLHVVTYTATDCAGNSTTATTVINVIDNQPPTVTPPANATIYVPAGGCEATFALPFPGISENCSLSGTLTLATQEVPLVFQQDPNAGLVPQDVTLNIVGAIPNAVSGGQLRIRHWGDFDESGEFFTVFGEGMPMPLIDTTTIGPSDDTCEFQTYHETVIPLSAAQINSWASDGSVSVTLKANTQVNPFFDFIQPCGVQQPGADGLSRVKALLEYDFAVVVYEIFQFGQTTPFVPPGTLNGSQTIVSLPPGLYTIKYSVADEAGLQGMASYALRVRDTIRPTAVCQPAIIQVNPSGSPGTDYLLQPSVVTNPATTDNCPGTLTYQVNPTLFTCNQANSAIPVTLTVTDAAGNTSTCTTLVSVQTAPPMPTYTPACLGDTLELFANAPQPGLYTNYTWIGPTNNVVYSGPNPNLVLPALQNLEGPWKIVVTGQTSCTSSATIFVNFFTSINPPTLTANGTPLGNNTYKICQGTDIVLTASGNNVANPKYTWFAGTSQASGGTPLGMGTSPQFTISQPAPGIYKFFVNATANGCSSYDSPFVTIEVQQAPVASVCTDAISVCPCQPITLCANTVGALPGTKYQWIGPGFADTIPQPLVTNCAGSTNAGQYTLVATVNGCVSQPVQVSVTVLPQPATPSAAVGDYEVCVGDTLKFSTSALQLNHIWMGPNNMVVDTVLGSSVYFHPNASLLDNGCWRVVTFNQFGCKSAPSSCIPVSVQAPPLLQITGDTTLCAGASLSLTASTIPTPGPPNNFYSFEWQVPGNVYTGVQTLQIPTNISPGQYVVEVKTIPNACSVRDTVNVQVFPATVIGALVPDVPACATGTTNGSIAPAFFTAALPIQQYIWSINGNLQSVNDSTFVIPGVSAASNGNYCLAVVDANGCTSSLQCLSLSVQNIPTAVTLSQLPAGPHCAGTNVTLKINEQNSNPAIRYFWTGPNGFADTTLASAPNLQLNNLTVNNAGVYTVRVFDSNSGCLSLPSTTTVIVHPIPPTPIINTPNSTVCAGTDVTLVTGFIQGATYSWMGPNFSAMSATNTTIVDSILLNQAGQYRVFITVNGCVSAQSEPLNVNVLAVPATPIAAQPANVCLATSDTLWLNVIGGQPGLQYQWYSASNPNLPIGPASASTSFAVTNLASYGPGAHFFFVRAINQICQSPQSTLVFSQFFDIPNIAAVAGDSTTICQGATSLTLQGVGPQGVTGLWTQLSGPAVLKITDPSNPQSLIQNSAGSTLPIPATPTGNPYQLVWTLSNGACMNFDSDTVSIAVITPVQPVSEPLVELCNVTSAQISATQGPDNNGFWSTPPDYPAQNIVVLDPFSPTTTVTGMTPGRQYQFWWNVPNPGCQAPPDTTIVRIHRRANVGFEVRNICNEDGITTVEFPLISPSFERVRWYSLTPGVQIIDPLLPTVTIANLRRDVPNLIVLELDGGFCGDLSRDTFTIRYQRRPVTAPDIVDVAYGGLEVFNVLTNDDVGNPDDVNITITQQPFNGTVTTVGNGVFEYRPNPGFTGTDGPMIYQVCTKLPCGENGAVACSSNTVTFRVNVSDDCVIPTVITPNGDDVNDLFVVSCLAEGDALESELTVFNQWGDQVFHEAPYGNGWNGTYNGEVLPSGTYFVVLKLNNAREVYRGFLMIQK